jgi:hypothetical protein
VINIPQYKSGGLISTTSINETIINEIASNTVKIILDLLLSRFIIKIFPKNNILFYYEDVFTVEKDWSIYFLE